MNRKRTCLTTVVFIILSLLLASHTGRAAESTGNDTPGGQSVRELLVGTSVKLLARGYVGVADLDRTKKANIARLEKMSDEEFTRKYAHLCEDMKGIPPGVKQAYGIDEKLDRSAAIQKIRSAGKKDITTIIDSIPNHFITKYFDAYLTGIGLDPGKIPSPREAILFWDTIRKKLDPE